MKVRQRAVALYFIDKVSNLPVTLPNMWGLSKMWGSISSPGPVLSIREAPISGSIRKVEMEREAFRVY